MSMQRTQAENLLKHYFQNANHAQVGDATGLLAASTVGSFYVSLHTGDPGETGDQTTSECNYTGYGREAVARTSGGWTVSTGVSPAVADNTAAITFGACTAGSNTATYAGVGTDSTGAGYLLWSGALSSSLAISSGITPQFAIGACNVTLE